MCSPASAVHAEPELREVSAILLSDIYHVGKTTLREASCKLCLFFSRVSSKWSALPGAEVETVATGNSQLDSHSQRHARNAAASFKLSV